MGNFGFKLCSYPDFVAEMSRDLNSLPIPPHVRFKLISHGFTTTEDLKNVTPIELAEETQMTPEDALEVLELVSRDNEEQNVIQKPTFVVSALDILLKEKSKPAIITFCQRLDCILGGGVPLRKLTEICGCPGSGKTQVCLQLSVNVQVPISCGGLDGEAVFIDTEGSFFVERLEAMAKATVLHCDRLLNKFRQDGGAAATDESEFTMEKVLKGIHYYRCTNYVEVIALVNVLPRFLEVHPKVHLIVIDSISFHFRYGFEKSFDRRTRLLNGLTQSLVKIAQEFDLAVVLTNQMTTKATNEKGLTLVPALGESWGHSCTIRLILSFEENKRQAYLFKSPWRQDDTAPFQITKSGIRDLKTAVVQDQRKCFPCSNFNSENNKLSKNTNSEMCVATVPSTSRQSYVPPPLQVKSPKENSHIPKRPRKDL